MDIKQKALKVIDITIYIMFFIVGSILSKILVMDGSGQQNVIWIFIPMGIYRAARIKFNILVASIIAALGGALCVFGFLALNSSSQTTTNLQDQNVISQKIENKSNPQIDLNSNSLSTMLLVSAQELKTNSSILCDFIKSGKHDQLDKDNGVYFNSTLNLVVSKEEFFESAYGEEGSMKSMLEDLVYGKVKDAKSLLYLSDFYYWYSIPLYNKYLDRDSLEKLHLEKDISSFHQPCNSYLYEIDKQWGGKHWDFTKAKNPTYERYINLIGIFD